MPSSNAPLLEYAPATARAPVGGLLFKPSLRSLALLALTALTILWLTRRHTPWRFVAEIPASYRFTDRPYISPDNRLFTCDARTGISWFDLTTAKPAEALFKSVDPRARYFPTPDGRHVVVFIPAAPTINLYDARTAQLVAQRPSPFALGYPVHFVSADATRALTPPFPARPARAPAGTPTTYPTVRLGGRPQPPGLGMILWDLTPAAPANPRPIARVDAPHITPLDGGTRLLLYDDPGALSVLDTIDLHPILTSDPASRWRLLPGDLSRPNLSVLVLPPRPGTTTCALYSLADGALLDSVSPPNANSDVSWSPDAAVRAVRTFAPGWGTLALHDRTTGRLLKTSSSSFTSRPIFFPGSRKYLVDGAPQIPIYDLHHTQPLALLDVAPGPRFSDAGIVISPDGRSILIRKRYGNGDVYHLHQPTGPDCPESSFGLLAFPHVWLLIALLTATTLSLLRDARRSNPLAPPPPRLIHWPLTVIALALTIHFTIEASRGEWIRTPAPALLLAAIVLNTGSRAARIATIVLLAATVVWCCQGLQWLRLPRPDTYALFDRTYPIPARLRLQCLAATTIAALAATVFLLLPARAAQQVARASRP